MPSVEERVSKMEATMIAQGERGCKYAGTVEEKLARFETCVLEKLDSTRREFRSGMGEMRRGMGEMRDDQQTAVSTAVAAQVGQKVNRYWIGILITLAVSVVLALLSFVNGISTNKQRGENHGNLPTRSERHIVGGTASPVEGSEGRDRSASPGQAARRGNEDDRGSVRIHD